jgi:ABC-2 type transport system ATP-binding protein
MYPTNSLVLEIYNLSKAYKGVQALNHVHLTGKQHSAFVFLGPNGAGKTTTMRLLLGPIRPKSGCGTVLAQDIFRDSIAIRSRVGHLPQQPRIADDMSARETPHFRARCCFKGPEADIGKRAAEILALVGLINKADQPIKGCSGGERQRLGIAHSHVNYPDLPILDEPAASLDPIGAWRFRNG